MSRLSLALGPVLFHWPEGRLRDFYAAVADEAPVDRVYLGEVVCGKRRPRIRAALEVARDRLLRAGKEVVWTSLAMPATPLERRVQKALLDATTGVVEINDISGLAQLPAGRSFVAGPLLNIYNEPAAQELTKRGCVRLCGNVELSLDALAAIHRACPTLELELFAFGRLPLAISSRCYHARLARLHKDACQFACAGDSDGQAVLTLEGRAFLAINGVQVLSHGVQLVSAGADTLRASGVTALRLSPHTLDMTALASAFRRFCDGAITAHGLRRSVMALRPPGDLVDGYPRGIAGWRLGDEA